MKNRSSIEKFEEFFKESYKDEIFNILETYPKNNSIIVNYNKLELFDPDLADLLIEKPEVTIEAAQLAIKNIDPLAKSADLDVKFENVINLIDFNELNHNHVREFICVDCIIDEVNEPKPIFKNTVFECRGCMRLYEIEQKDFNHLLEPSLCGECGGRSFRLLRDKSDYKDVQLIVVTNKNTKRKRKVILFNDDCSDDDYHVGDSVRITGSYLTLDTKKGMEYYLNCNFIEFLDDEIEVFEEPVKEKEYGDRNSPEYDAWRKEVVNRDKVCQCCGYDNKLQAHHIYGYRDNKELRVDPDNGITLCVFCHDKYHSAYGRDNANPKDLVKFIKRFGGGR